MVKVPKLNQLLLFTDIDHIKNSVIYYWCYK